MSGRRRKRPARRGAADLNALERNPPPQVFARRLVLDRRLSLALLCLLTVVLLSVSFAPFDAWYLAYVAFVPWLIAVEGGTRGRSTLLFAWLAGLLFWAINLYWLWWVTLLGYALLVVYLSAYWLVAAWLIRGGARRNVPTWVTLPVVWVALEYARAYLLSGFPWFYVAHTQYACTRLIQICDVTGQYGVSFVVLWVNGVAVDLLTAPLFARAPERRAVPVRRHLVALAASLAAIAALLGYGQWRLGQDTQSPGPVVGVVQETIPVWLGPTPKAPDRRTQRKWDASPYEVFDMHCEWTRGSFTDAGCDLVIWPETVLPRGMNREVLEVNVADLSLADARSLALQVVPMPAAELKGARRSELRRYLQLVIRGRAEGVTSRGPSLESLARRLGRLSDDVGCPILAGGPAVHPNGKPTGELDRWMHHNSALWFEGNWRNKAEYAKVHLVPLSEYVPFKHSLPRLYRTLRSFVPPQMPQVEPGKRLTAFALTRRGRTWHVATPICYEGTFARVCRRMVVQDGEKVVDILANLSNDGWFVWPWRPRVGQASAEHVQHLVQYCFRAVENRVPVVRAVNTGISASIDSNGRIVGELRLGGRRAGMVSGTMLLKDAGDGGADAAAGHGDAGGGPTSTSPGTVPAGRSRFPQVLVDSRVSLYSIVGDAFAQGVSVAAIVLAAWMLVGQEVRRRRDRQGSCPEKAGT